MAHHVLFLGGLAFAIMLDVAVSIFFTHTILSLWYEYKLEWWHYLFIAPLIGLFPDLDTLWQYARERKVDDRHHQSFTHRPILMITPPLVAWPLFSWEWGLVITLGLFGHYLHDSTGYFGIGWFWPISGDHFCLRTSGVHRYKANELKRLHRSYVPVPTWLARVYYVPSMISVIELCLSTILIGIVAVTYFDDLLTPFMIVISMLAGAKGVWKLGERIYVPS